MRRFLISGALFSIPFLFLLVCYICFDPFKVIKHYDNYYFDEGGGATNRGFVSTMNYLNRKDSCHYDSFIFGNSRSMYYRVDDWKKHIPQESRCYHFSESGGSLEGIYYKMRLIDEQGERIKNALVVLEVWVLNNMDSDGALFIAAPALVHNRNIIRFHWEHFTQWLKMRFFLLWADYKLTGTFKSYMKDVLMKGGNNKYYDPITNEEPRAVEDSLIRVGAYYTEEKIREFGGQSGGTFCPVRLDNLQKVDCFKRMAEILKRHRADFKIIIGPMYDQKRLHPTDLRVLKSIFGNERVYDLSGVNKWTSDYHNYYEYSHYLPSTSAEVMDSIYSH